MLLLLLARLLFSVDGIPRTTNDGDDLCAAVAYGIHSAERGRAEMIYIKSAGNLPLVLYDAPPCANVLNAVVHDGRSY